MTASFLVSSGEWTVNPTPVSSVVADKTAHHGKARSVSTAKGKKQSGEELSITIYVPLFAVLPDGAMLGP